MEKQIIERKEALVLLKTRMDIIRTNIRRLMKEQVVTQTELGIRIDSDKFYISYVLNHPSANPSIMSMEKIAKALETTISDLSRK